MIEDFYRIVILIIVTIFPIFIYTEYLEGKKNITKKEEFLFLDGSLFFSHFLLIETMLFFGNYDYLIISVIPCLVALFKRHYFSYLIILSVLLIDLHINAMFPTLFVLLFSFIFFILLYIYLNSNMSKKKFIDIFFIVQSILYILNFIIFLPKELNIIYDYFIHILCFFISVKIGCAMLLQIETTNTIRKNSRELAKNKDIKDSLFKITHEIKNPIAVVSGYLTMFDTKDKKKSDRYIKIIKEEINRVLNLLSDFLSMNTVTLNKENINIKDLFDETRDILIPLFEEKNIHYRFNIERNVVINADYNRMKQVLINLIKNSIEASNKNSSVFIDGFTSNDKFVIYVTDFGKGMTKETQELINSKTPFYTTKQNGTGLGVCLSREIIEAHGGKMDFSSVLNNGTIFKIIIPIK